MNHFEPNHSFSDKTPADVDGPLRVLIGGLPEISVSVHRNISEISQIWLKFQLDAATTLQQNYQWCNAWQDTVGRVKKVVPCILIGRMASGRIAFILPLQIRKSLGLSILEWHSYPSVNYGYGLFDLAFLPGAARWFAENCDAVLAIAGHFDVLALRDLPTSLHGHPHPLQALVNLRAANRGYALRLKPDFETLYAEKRSCSTRKSHRKRDARLAAMGTLSFGLPSSRGDAHRILDEMFSYQAQRLAQYGVHGIFSKTERDFFHRLTDDTNGKDPFLLPYVLKCNEDTLSVMLGGISSRTFWPFITSIAPGPAQKHSPGDYLLRRVIEACCNLGLTTFDFASGDSLYKLQWSDETIELNDVLRAANLKGMAWVVVVAARMAAKRFVKRNSAVLSLALLARRVLAGNSPATSSED